MGLKSHGPMAVFFLSKWTGCEVKNCDHHETKKIGELFQVSSKIFLGFLRENRGLHFVSSHVN